MHLLNNIVAFPDIDQCKFEGFYFETINQFDTGEIGSLFNGFGFWITHARPYYFTW